MKNNSIVTNLQQDLTDGEKIQARLNIGAGKSVSVTNPVTGYNGDLSLNYSTQGTKTLVNVAGNTVGILPSNPSETNKVFGVNSQGNVGWQDPSASSINYTQRWDGDYSNTTVIDPTNTGYISCPYTKFLFSCQLYSQINQNPYNVSLCPVNYIGQSYEQPTLDTGGMPYTVNIPPCDDTSYGNGYHNWITVSCMWNHPDIRYIAIKGNSDWCTNSDYRFGIKNITMIELP